MSNLISEAEWTQVKPMVKVAVGDLVRVYGPGPQWITRDGNKIPMGERGTFTVTEILREPKPSTRRWLRARQAGGGAETMIYVGGKCKNRHHPEMKMQPHRISATRETAREKSKRKGKS